MAVPKNKNIYRSYKKLIRPLKIHKKKKPIIKIHSKEIPNPTWLPKLIMLNHQFDTYSTILLYIFVYNLTITGFFSLIFFYDNSYLKTLSSLSSLDKSVRRYLLMFHLFSIAGLPPFIGFFTKINLITLGSYSSFLLFTFLMPLLFASMFFYIQTIRFLLNPSSSENNFSPSLFIQNSTWITSLQVLLGFSTIFGVFFFDDILLFIWWIFS